MHSTNIGKDITCELEKMLEKYWLQFKQTSLFSDRWFSCNYWLHKIYNFYCILHKEKLWSKIFNLNYVLNWVVLNIYTIRAQELSHERFVYFYRDVECEKNDLSFEITEFMDFVHPLIL
jgi:hypothetical protein